MQIQPDGQIDGHQHRYAVVWKTSGTISLGDQVIQVPANAAELVFVHELGYGCPDEYAVWFRMEQVQTLYSFLKERVKLEHPIAITLPIVNLFGRMMRLLKTLTSGESTNTTFD